jgi:RND family efflux transporter MFP subunit
VAPAIQAAVTEVRTAPVPLRVEVTGQVIAAAQAVLSSQVRGAVQEITVREGAAVKKGQPLVLLDQRDVRAGLARAEAEAENAGAQLARMERLFKEESVARQELDNARRAAKVAEAGRQAALAQHSYTIIRAPFDGVVVEKKIEVGELASPGQPLVKVEDPSRFRLEATLAESDLKAVARGDSMPVVVDALGSEPKTGTVAQILPTGDPATHTFLVKIDLPPLTGLKSGMFGRMQLDKGSVSSLVVPKAAVQERGQLTGVFVVGPDMQAHLRYVKIGRSLDGDVEVLSGVNAGERVLAEAAKGVDGAKIEIMEAVAVPAPANR